MPSQLISKRHFLNSSKIFFFIPTFASLWLVSSISQFTRRKCWQFNKIMLLFFFNPHRKTRSYSFEITEYSWLENPREKIWKYLKDRSQWGGMPRVWKWRLQSLDFIQISFHWTGLSRIKWKCLRWRWKLSIDGIIQFHDGWFSLPTLSILGPRNWVLALIDGYSNTPSSFVI